MTDFDKTITRANVGSIVPTQFADEIIKQLPQTSIVAKNARKVTMSSKEYKQSVLATLPEAFFSGDGALAKTTKAEWEDLSIVADTLTCIVPIPNTVLSDAKINIWDEITPLVTQAMGKKIDEAVIFNIGKPTAWNATSLIEGATTASNVLKLTAQKGIAVAVPELAGKIATQGFAINGFVHAPGMDWKLRGLLDSTGQPIFVPSITQAGDNTLYGKPLDELGNGGFDTTKAELVMVDWSKVIYGVRNDMQVQVLKEAVISDETGKVVLNLAQQDYTALKFTARVGYQVANPVTAVQDNKTKRFPAGIIQPATS